MSTEHDVCRVVSCLGRDTDSELGGEGRGVAPSEVASCWPCVLGSLWGKGGAQPPLPVLGVFSMPQSNLKAQQSQISLHSLQGMGGNAQLGELISGTFPG